MCSGAIGSAASSTNTHSHHDPDDVFGTHRVAAAADFASRARSPVLRDSRTREIVLVPEPEVGARLAVELHQLACGLKWIGTPRPLRQEVIRAAAHASIPRIRRLALKTLLDASATFSTTDVALALRLPSNTVRRALEELAALAVLDTKQDSYRQHWSAAQGAREQWNELHRGNGPD